MAGRSNVGKSSLINAVLNRRSIARVSQTPGKTQAVQFYLVNEKFFIVDLPGYGYAKVPADIRKSWGSLVRGYLEQSEALQLLFLLLDSRRDPTDDDRQLHYWSQAASVDEQIVMTKSDKLSKTQLLKARTGIANAIQVGQEQLIPFSSVTKEGIDRVRREIASRL